MSSSRSNTATKIRCSALKAIQYDIVCNGIELSSGAIRNHRPEVMKKAFAIAGYDESVLEEKFGGMLHALSLGAPPHGGIAPGIDRIVMLLCGEENLREVVLFPMNQRAEDLMMGAPSEVTRQAIARAAYPGRASGLIAASAPAPEVLGSKPSLEGRRRHGGAASTLRGPRFARHLRVTEDAHQFPTKGRAAVKFLGLFRGERHRRFAQRSDDLFITTVHPFRAHQPQDEAEFAQHLERMPVAVAKGARELKGSAFVAPPALHRNNRRAETGAGHHRRAGAETRADGAVLRAEAEPALDAAFETRSPRRHDRS